MEENLIEFVSKNEFLYDKKHRNYKNLFLRDKAFEELSTQINIPAKSLKDRWRTLRNRFYKEMKNENLPSGSGAGSPKKKWKWMENMIFLKDVVIANPNTYIWNFYTFMLDNPHISSDRREPPSPCTPTSAQAGILDADDLSTPAKKKEKLDEIFRDVQTHISNVVTLAKEVFTVPTVPKTAAQYFFDEVVCNRIFASTN